MKIKRIFGIVVCAVLCVAATACGGKMPEEKTGMLFDDEAGTYNYAPSVLQVSDTERYVYYCGSPGQERIVDLVQCRKGVKNTKTGQWEYGDLVTVLRPTYGTWDETHVCDPAILQGEFKYKGTTYKYLLSYLGCATTNNQENEMGFAVSNDPMAEFIKCDDINPFIAFERDPEYNSSFQWGFGQASMISVDKKGKVLLFYTEGNARETYQHVDRWDLSDLSKPVKEFAKRMKTAGLTNPYGGSDNMNSADFMYDAENKRIYAVSPVHSLLSENNLTHISEITRVTYIDELEGDKPGDGFAADKLSNWKTLFTFSKATTGFDYQHNCGFVRDAYGWMAEKDVVEVIYTRGIIQPDDYFRVVWTYRLYNYRYTQLT